jgi:hypothetical protein
MIKQRVNRFEVANLARNVSRQNLERTRSFTDEDLANILITFISSSMKMIKKIKKEFLLES